MDCPKCPGAPLEEKEHAEGLLIDLCGSCGGAWADRAEVVRFVGRYTLLEKGLPVGPPSPTHLGCPRCGRLMDLVALADARLEFEVCAACGGTWFDGREVQALRAHLARLAAPPPASVPAPPRRRLALALPVLLGVGSSAAAWLLLHRAPPPAPPAAAAPAKPPVREAPARAPDPQEPPAAPPAVVGSGEFPGPCAQVETFSGREASAEPGEIVEFRGSFRERTSFKLAMLSNGPMQPVEVADWSGERVVVRLPRWLSPGRYRLSVRCYYDGQVYSRGYQDVRVLHAPAPRQDNTLVRELPLMLSGDPAEMLGSGQAMMALRRYADAHRAFGAAADSYHVTPGQLGREVAARRERIAAAEAAGWAAEAHEERKRIRAIYRDASRAAVAPEDAARLELAHAEIGFELARFMHERGDFAGAESIYAEQVATFDRHKQGMLKAIALKGLALEAAARGDLTDAQSRYSEAAKLFREERNMVAAEECERAVYDLRRDR